MTKYLVRYVGKDDQIKQKYCFDLLRLHTNLSSANLAVLRIVFETKTFFSDFKIILVDTL